MEDDDKPFPSPLQFTTPAPHQIQCCIDKSRPYKAPGSDGIPNIVLKKSASLLVPLLHNFLTAILHLRYFPKEWHEWTTIILRKPGRSDYTIAKSYRPIALYKTMSKII
ncbi:hypothetical protein K439DRAFT_1360197, partial [Ramaria rubella]